MKPYVLPTAAALAGAAVMAATAVWASVSDETIGYFTRDIRVLAAEEGTHLRYYVGAVAMLTNLLWIAGASMSAAAALVARSGRLWFTALAVLMVVLGLDDAFMLHESVGPYYGVPEWAFFAAYALAGLGLALMSLRLRSFVTKVVFVAGIGLLAAGLGADVLWDDPFLVEDGLKLMGVAVLGTVPIGPVVEARRELTACRKSASAAESEGGIAPVVTLRRDVP